MLPSGNTGNTGNNHLPMSILVSIGVLVRFRMDVYYVNFAEWKTWSDARSN